MVISIIKFKKTIISGSLSGLRYNHFQELFSFNVGEPITVILRTLLDMDPKHEAWQGIRLLQQP